MIHSRFNKNAILEALKPVFKSKDFVFNGEFFHQIVGNAMSNIAAPTYATLVMGYPEIKMIIIIMQIMKIKIFNSIKI